MLDCNIPLVIYMSTLPYIKCEESLTCYQKQDQERIMHIDKNFYMHGCVLDKYRLEQ